MVQRNPAVLWRRTLDGAVLLVPGRAEPLRLNATAAIVWDLLDEPATTAQLAAEVAEAFDIASQEASADITAGVGALRDEGALTT